MRQVKIGDLVEGKEISEVGVQYDFKVSSDHLLPVKFRDNGYAIVSWNDEGLPKVWWPDVDKGVEALTKSVEMPTVCHGIGSGAIHVGGVDSIGKFFIKLTYGWRKMEHGDEFRREQ